MKNRAPLVTALGHERVLHATTDPRHRVIALLGETVVGVSAFEQLYGPRAEFAVSLRDPADGALARRLVVALASVAAALGIRTLRAEVSAAQRAIAIGLPGVNLAPSGIEVDVAAATSVATTDSEGQHAPLASDVPTIRIVT